MNGQRKWSLRGGGPGTPLLCFQPEEGTYQLLAGVCQRVFWCGMFSVWAFVYMSRYGSLYEVSRDFLESLDFIGLQA